MSDNSNTTNSKTTNSNIFLEKSKNIEQLSEATESNADTKSISESCLDERSVYDEIQEEASQFKITEEFKEQVIRYINYDDLIKKKNEEVKELKDLRKPCEEFILNYLDEIQINHIDVSGGKIVKSKTETKVPITKDLFKDTLSQKIDDPSIISELVKLIDNRPKKVSVKIKRTTVKQRKRKL